MLMIWLMSFAAIGMGLLVDVTDMMSTETETYNEGHPLAVGPYRYIAGYLLVFCSVQAFDGVVGSVLSKVIPTALASGTLVSCWLHFPVSCRISVVFRSISCLMLDIIFIHNLNRIQAFWPQSLER